MNESLSHTYEWVLMSHIWTMASIWFSVCVCACTYIHVYTYINMILHHLLQQHLECVVTSQKWIRLGKDIKRVVPHTPTHQFVASRFWMYRVTQCVAECCSVLQCVAACCSMLQYVAVCCSVLRCVALCCSMLQCVAVCCSVLQCVALCCVVLQCVPHTDTYESHLWIYRHTYESIVTYAWGLPHAYISRVSRWCMILHGF